MVFVLRDLCCLNPSRYILPAGVSALMQAGACQPYVHKTFLTHLPGSESFHFKKLVTKKTHTATVCFSNPVVFAWFPRRGVQMLKATTANTNLGVLINSPVEVARIPPPVVAASCYWCQRSWWKQTAGSLQQVVVGFQKKNGSVLIPKFR